MRHGRKTSRLSCFARCVQSKRGWRTVGFSHPSAFRGLHQPVIMDGEHVPCDQGGHNDDGDEAVDHGLLASSIRQTGNGSAVICEDLDRQ